MVASVTRLKAAATTVHYFEVDGYYARNDPEHRKASRWHGEAAALLGLHGPVNPKRFEAVLAGYVPGTDLQPRAAARRRAPAPAGGGRDLLGAQVGLAGGAGLRAAQDPRTRVVRAHDEAVRATLGLHRDGAAPDPEPRSRDRPPAAGAGGRHGGGDLPPPGEPQPRPAAPYPRSDRQHDARPGRGLAQRRVHLGGTLEAPDRGLLPQRAPEPGWRRSATPRRRRWWAGCRGSRSRATGGRCWTRSRPGAGSFWTTCRSGAGRTRRRRTQQAALYTRQRKAEPDRRVLHETWRERAREIGPARDRDVARGRNGIGVAASHPHRVASRELPSALSVVRRAVEHLEERRTVFSANDLRAWALAHGGGRHSLEDLDAGIAQLRRDGHLIEAKARRADLAFVTDRARAAERDIISGMGAGPGCRREPVAAGRGRGRAWRRRTERGPARRGACDPAVATPDGGGCRATRAPARPPCCAR